MLTEIKWVEMANRWLGAAGDFALRTLLPTALILVIGLVLIRAVSALVKKLLAKSGLEKAAHKLIRTAISAVLYILLALIAASWLGLDVTGIIALASVLTLAVSLAVQNALTNVISGFTLLYTKPFSSGDFVEVAGQSGSVDEIGLTYTKLRTPDNKHVFIPNGAVTAAQIVNYTVLGKRRIEIKVSASYESPMALVLEGLKEAGSVPTALPEEGVFAAVDSYGDSAIVYVLRLWATTDTYWDTAYEVNRRIKEVFDAQGIQMTYPHMNVHIHN